MITTLMTQWQGALQLLAPSHIKIFFLVSAKNAFGSANLLLGYFWWAYAFSLLSTILATHIIVPIPTQAWGILCCILTVLACRAALERKDFSYFIYYFAQWKTLVAGLLLSVLTLMFEHVFAHYTVSFFAALALAVVFVLTYITIFFLYDASEDKKKLPLNLRKALIFFGTCFPVCIVLGILGVLSYAANPIGMISYHLFDPWNQTLVRSFLGSLALLVECGLYECLKIGVVALVATYYTKIKYEKYRLFEQS